IFEKRFLQRMQAVRTNYSFDSFDFSTFRFHSENQTGIYQPAIQNNVAGATIAVVATFLGSSQFQFIAQNLEQSLEGLAKKFSPLAIDRSRHMNFSWHRSGLLGSFNSFAHCSFG